MATLDSTKEILIVEDDPDVRGLVRTFLEKKGYRVAAVPHGEQALDYLAQETKPKLILLDLYMPVMDGWEFRDEQMRRPDIKDIPVVIITAASDAKVKPITAELVIKKPLDMARLLDAATQYCGPPRA